MSATVAVVMQGLVTLSHSWGLDGCSVHRCTGLQSAVFDDSLWYSLHGMAGNRASRHECVLMHDVCVLLHVTGSRSCTVHFAMLLFRLGPCCKIPVAVPHLVLCASRQGCFCVCCLFDLECCLFYLDRLHTAAYECTTVDQIPAHTTCCRRYVLGSCIAASCSFEGTCISTAVDPLVSQAATLV